MEIIKAVFGCKEGKIAVLNIVLGIAIAGIGGKFARGLVSTDIVIMAGCILSVVGTQMLSRLLIMYREQLDKKNNEDEQ